MKRNVMMVVLALVVALALRQAFPKTVQIPSHDNIVTHYDTVFSIDTVWHTKLIKEPTLPPVSVTVTVAETIPVLTHPIKSMQAVMVGKDSTRIGGFYMMQAEDGRFISRMWEASYVTTGAVKAILFDSIPPQVSFYPAPKKGWTGWDKAKFALEVFAAGYLTNAILTR